MVTRARACQRMLRDRSAEMRQQITYPVAHVNHLKLLSVPCTAMQVPGFLRDRFACVHVETELGAHARRALHVVGASLLKAVHLHVTEAAHRWVARPVEGRHAPGHCVVAAAQIDGIVPDARLGVRPALHVGVAGRLHIALLFVASRAHEVTGVIIVISIIVVVTE